MNNLDICAFNIGHSYLNALCRGKLWNEAGSEFGSDKGYVFLIIRALCGLKLSGASCTSNLAETLNSMVYRSNESEPEVCINRATIENVTDYFTSSFLYMSMMC